MKSKAKMKMKMFYGWRMLDVEAACVTDEEKARENFAIEPVDQALALAWIP